MLVVGDDRTLRVHVHTDDPDAAAALFAHAGEVSRFDVADMHEQVADRSARLSGEAQPSELATCAVVAVASGEGVKRLYEELGVLVVDGGPTMNPSTYELLAGIHAAPGAEVVVLPNSPNVILAAERACELSEKPAAVVPTTAPQEGLAALLAFDPDRPAEQNAAAVTSAAEALRIGGVAPAARDDVQGRFTAGDAVGYAGGELVAWGDPAATLAATLDQLVDGAELLTCIAGDAPPLGQDDVQASVPDGRRAGVPRGRAARLVVATLRGMTGIVPGQGLADALAAGWITSEKYRIPDSSIQPASMDLRLGARAWALRCSFLPDTASSVMDRVHDLAQEELDIRDGAQLERDRPYVIELVEEVRLPAEVRAKANPKSSTGRLDVFTRVITDRNNRFDEIPAGYEGKLYLEVVPRSFAVRVEELLSLNQLRLVEGDPRVADAELRELHAEVPLLYRGDEPVPAEEIAVADGLFLGLDLKGPRDRVVGYRAKRHSHRVDMTKIRHYDWRDYWEPVYPEEGGRIVLDPEVFYLLLSAEGVCVPPDYAAEMMAYDPTAGELRTHYAGFFDPGFGYDAHGSRPGSRAALEVRARDVPFMVEDGQPICKLAFERMTERPEKLYGEDVGSNYQGQETMLSKHFVAQTAGAANPPGSEAMIA